MQLGLLYYTSKTLLAIFCATLAINNQVKSYFSFLTDALHTMQHPRLLSDSLFFRVEKRNIRKGVSSPETGAN